MSTAALVWGGVFGSVGLSFFVYGKRQHAVVPLVCGVGLMLLPHVVSTLVPLIGIGVVFIALPYFLRL